MNHKAKYIKWKYNGKYRNVWLKNGNKHAII